MKRRATGIARLFVLALLVMVMVSLMGIVAFAQETDISAEKECYLTGDMNADGSFSTEDAIYTLYHTLFEDSYPIRQNVDVNGDEVIDTMDAIEILYATLFDYLPKYENFGKLAHDYYDPAWSWETADGVTATVTLQCACGEKSHTMEAEVLPGARVDATCTAPGYQEYTAQVSDENETFTSTYKVTLPAAGHEAGETAFDEMQHYTCCANCGEVISSEIHIWKADGAPVEGDCKVPTVQNYLCACGAVKSEELGTLEHVWEYTEDVLVDGCTYARKHVCGSCGEVKLTDEYENHDFVASIQEATCQKDGQKVYTCSKCGAVDKTEIIASSADKHVWDDGVEKNGVITYTCGICGQTKTAVVAKDDGTISGDALQNADELEVGDTTMSMDEAVKENLGNNDVQITVDPLKPEELAGILKEDELAQIEGNTVYDFNMTVGGQAVSKFDGKITISLPYTLEEGEDIDGIDVWYINANGELVQQEATYSNGYVTFTTDHFSYYTVTRLTPEQRCARYGHIWTDASKLPTCTSDGYNKRVCQRCAKEEVLEVQSALGHDYKTTVTEPTCDQFGSTVTTCTHCGHTTSAVVPALGHKLKLSETVEATCDAAGKYVFVCANGCGYEAEQEIPQLSHEYGYGDTVEATCTTGGYDLYVCKHCGNEIKKNETTPIGHNFSTESAQWVWNKKNTSATLTLTCDHGCGSTKELKATVTTVEASCLNDGLVLATVYYNNKTYSDKKAGDPATGHKPGAEWIITETHHYYECEVCGEKIEAATHDLGNGVVTREPTCNAEGLKVYTCSVCGYSYEEVLAATGKHNYDEGIITKEPTCAAKGSKLYTCADCGKTREETVPATGKHDYVDGKCSVCGKAQSDCDHWKRTEKVIDLSGLGICEGMELVEISCECGEFRVIEINNNFCDLNKVYSEETEYSRVEAYECSKCGFYAIASQELRFSTDPCRAEVYYWAELKVGDRIIAEFDSIVDSAEHYTHVLVSEEKVNTKGMCDLTVRTYACDCGERTNVEVESACQWNIMDNGDRAFCTVCGGNRKRIEHEPIIEGCKITHSCSWIYQNAEGEELYTELQEYSYFEHNYVITNYELLGETCDDGVWIEHTCTKCGEVFSETFHYHEMVNKATTDLSNANICATAHVQRVCACGQQMDEELVYEEGECQWAYILPPGEEIDQLTSARCSICGATRTAIETVTEKDENCRYVRIVAYTYKDASGNILVTADQRYTFEEHNLQREYELLGDSCEDGVIIHEYCTGCDWHNQWETHSHDAYQTVYQLSEYGYCGGEVSVSQCPCGEEKYIDLNLWGCDWRGMGDEGWEYCECGYCGGVWERNWSEEVIDACHSQSLEDFSFRINGEEVLSFQFTNCYTTHSWLCELTLMGETCDDGYQIARTCLNCGQTEKFMGWGCEMFAVNCEMYTETGLCGDVELVTYSCACGKNTRTDVEWHNGQCHFEHTAYIGDDSYIYTCTECGAVRYEYYSEDLVPGEPECAHQHSWEHYYELNEQILFVVTGVEYYTSHEWTYDFTMQGSSCEDGVIVRRICKYCGINSDEYVIYDHNTFGSYYELADYGFCGGYVEVHSCPCGEVKDVYLEPYVCDWQQEYDDGRAVKHVCATCGSSWEAIAEETQITTCITHADFEHTFTQADGTEVLHLVWTRKYENHDYTYSFNCMGDSCEDGVTVIEECKRCGYTCEGYTEYHENYLLEHYDLAQYGMCDGYLNVYGCACGESRHAEWYSNCTWYGIGGENTNGFDETCGNCGMTWSWHWETVEQIDSCTIREKNTIICAKGEHTIFVTWNETRERHNYVYRLTLLEGSESCEDGYEVERYCEDCGRILSRYGQSGYHETFLIATQTVTLDAPVCGEVILNTYSCACGKETDTEYQFPDCQFEYIYMEEYGWCYCCVNCGLIHTTVSRNEPVEGTTCQYTQITEHRYVLDGEVILTSEHINTYESHTLVSTQTLLVPGGTCDDGYNYTFTCVDCGTVTSSGTNYGCSDMQRIGYEKLASKDEICGDLYLNTYSCACGKNSTKQIQWKGDHCSFSDYWDQELGRWVYTCMNCGVQKLYSNTSEYIEGTECQYRVIEKNVFMRDGVELFSYETYAKTTRHNEVAQLTLVVPGGTCDDGYTVTHVCLDCGKITERNPDIYYGCSNWSIGKELLAGKGDLCGDLYIQYYGCACGKQHGSNWSWDYGNCWFQYVEYNEEEQCYIYACEQCGAYRKEYNEYTKLDGLECTNLHKWDSVYYNANGEYLFTESGEDISHNGTWVYNYYLMGDSCDDGYTWTRYCYYCGETEECTEPSYGCNGNLVEIVPGVASRDDICGRVAMYIHNCACGNNLWWNIKENCSFCWFEWDEETQRDIYKCSNCGLMYSGTSTTETQPNSCLVTETVQYDYWIMDGEEKISVGSLYKVFSRRQHQIVYDLIPVEGATSCDDGYYVIGRCLYCDFVSDDGISYGHAQYVTQLYSLADFGMCNGYIQCSRCACGEQEEWQCSAYSCDHYFTGNQNEYGMSQRYCKKCNTYFYLDSIGEYVEEDCAIKYVLHALLERDGEVLLNMTQHYEQKEHMMLAVGFDGTCGDRVTVYKQCYYCGKQDTVSGPTSHGNQFLVDFLNLEMLGACGGYAEQYSCACGEKLGTNMNTRCYFNYSGYTTEEIDGILYYTETRTCKNCGLSIVQTYYDSEKDEHCNYNRIYTYEFRMNGELVKIMRDYESYQDHNYELTSLELQGESCEDGVHRVYTCQCGASYDNYYYEHYDYIDEALSIDMSQYGSVCGCKLDFYTCACGKYQHGDLIGECDLDCRATTVWIEDALNISQPNTNGWNYEYSTAYTYTCAVTDPQCGLGVRMAHVWLKGDNCTAQRYEIWQLGYQAIYNEATGETTYTWEKEIVIPSGIVVSYHEYDYQTMNSRDNGTGTFMESYICKDCGSSYVITEECVDWSTLRYEVIAMNTLDNDSNKYYRYVREYGFTHNENLYETLERYEYIHADGSEYWYQWETSYISDAGCKYQRIYSNSNGYESIDEAEHYFTYNKWDWEKYPTCSQPGVEVCTEICELCQEIVNVYYNTVRPNRHDWWWNSVEGFYYCGTCGLENCNGADGTIVLEDMTAQYGNGTDYVIGYWNRSDGNFTVYASVILDDADDEMREIVLTDIDFNYLSVEQDGINALTTNQAAIAEAAATAIADAGYTGSYAIRIAFVAADDDGMLDYAITFDSVMA